MKFCTEVEFIQRIRALARRKTPGLIQGIGDDTAIFESGPNNAWCITTDLLHERVHFDRRYDPPRSVGHKALAAGLSDIASMGAGPRFALVSIAVPKRQAQDFLAPFYAGFLALADRHHVVLIGGDTSASPGGIYIDVIVLGELGRSRGIRRSGACVGDRIFVTGKLGRAAWGLALLKAGCSPQNRAQRMAIQRHRSPIPRTEIGAWLGKKRMASAMIDISDGLSTDLNHLCRESGVGARIEENKIPLAAKERASFMLDHALCGGEDYELLFTVPPRNLSKIRPRVEGVPLTEIGEILPEKEGVVLISSDGSQRTMPASGWDHFK